MRSHRLIGIVVLGLTALSCGLFNRGPKSGGSAQPGPSAVLNEILFLPAQGESPFVEVKGTRANISAAGLTLVNNKGDSYVMPDGLPKLGPAAFALIIFDGGSTIDGPTAHASPQDFLDPKAGWVELKAPDGTTLDRVAWGDHQPGAVNLSRGGSVDDFNPGTSIGRFPGSVDRAAIEWTIFQAPNASPGLPNPLPGVEIMLPVSGAILRQSNARLSWYPAPGAIGYQVQVASDSSFTSIISDQTTSSPEATVQLKSGTYYWRVLASGNDGTRAEFSPGQTLTVDSGLSQIPHHAVPRQQGSLAVPMLFQHKDTAMLLLETPRETGEHAWDTAHPGLDPSDPADAMNCAIASVAMINNFLGGDLSQDRIGYEIRKDDWPGPEYDVNFGAGLSGSQELQALSFALAADAAYHPAGESPDTFWDEITTEIDEGRPIFATIPGHALVITGYRQSGDHRIVAINDPWWGAYEADVDVVPWAKHFTISPASIPVFQEPEISIDSDGDGVVDFDETERFGTNPHDEDTEKDDVKDKQDIRASIFDDHFGYALTGDLIGRDYDGDSLTMELDPDSDGGGCFDGMEDPDFDGRYKEPETWNFDENDDACIHGTDEIVLDEDMAYEDGHHHQRVRSYVTFALQPVEGNKLEGLAQIYFTHTGEFAYDICSGTHSIPPQYFQSKLTGQVQKLPGDAGVLVGFQGDPPHGPPYTVHWNTACPAEDYEMPGWTWPGMSGTLKDGVYDYYADLAAASGTNGEFWEKTHIEQGGAKP